jgi:hypothetical protein
MYVRNAKERLAENEARHMKKSTLMFAVLGVTALLASPAQAHDNDHHDRDDHHVSNDHDCDNDNHHAHNDHRVVVYYNTPHVVYQPQYYRPAPVVVRYYTPPPVYYYNTWGQLVSYRYPPVQYAPPTRHSVFYGW